jgi:hypothetical protein
VDHALRRGGVDALDRRVQLGVDVIGTGLGGLGRRSDAGLQLGPDGLVALVALVVLLVALDLALDVGDGRTCSWRRRKSADSG